MSVYKSPRSSIVFLEEDMIYQYGIPILDLSRFLGLPPITAVVTCKVVFSSIANFNQSA